MRIWLRDHWHATATVTAIAIVATTGMLAPGGFAGPAALRVDPLAPIDAGIHFSSGSLTATAIANQGVDRFRDWLLAMGWTSLGVGMVTILALFGQQVATRAPEVAIHRAVGASRRALIGSASGEAGLVLAISLGLGVGIGAAAGFLSAARWPGAPAAWTLALGAPLVAIGAAVGLGSLFPLWGVRSRRIAESNPLPPPLGIASAQLGASLAMLVAGATIVARTRDTAPEPRHLPRSAAIVTTLVSANADPVSRAQELSAWLASLGHRKASVASAGAHVGLGTVDELVTDCGQCLVGGIFLKWRNLRAAYQTVSADTFEARGIRLLSGRDFEPTDGATGERVAIVNRYLAGRYFEGGNPLGRLVFPGGRMSDPGYRVIGVVDDGRAAGLGGGLQPLETIYLSSLQHAPVAVEVVTSPAPAAIGSYRRVAQRSGAALAATIDAPARWFGLWFLALGTVVLALAVAGTMSLMLVWVRALRPELAIRRSVGATRGDVVRQVLVQAAKTGLIGVGACLAFFGPAIWPELSTILPGTPPWQPALVARFGIGLVLAALVAGVIPAIRAGRMSPIDLFNER